MGCPSFRKYRFEMLDFSDVLLRMKKKNISRQWKTRNKKKKDECDKGTVFNEREKLTFVLNEIGFTQREINLIDRFID